jgi:hypothetical protein
MPGEATPGCKGTAGGGCLHSLDPDHAHPHRHAHKTSRAQGKGDRGARQTAWQSTIEDADAKNMPNKNEPNRKYMPAECGGVTTPPLLSIALRLQTARGK